MTRQILFCFMLLLPAYGQPARVVTYNLLNYNHSGERNEYFRTVMEAAAPDILVVQEIVSQAAINNFLSSVLNYTDSAYSAGIFIDGPDSDNAIFYRPALFEFVTNTPIVTALRDINRFTMVHRPSGDTLMIYSVHLKAGTGATNQQQRLAETLILRQATGSLPAGADFLVAGDFNFYTSGESAYQVLLDPAGPGYVLDPIDTPGNWHDTPAFAEIHTQSTRTRQFGGGASGGLDDRFDLILASQGVMDAGGIEYVSGSYTAFGNDGMHFNDSINAMPNTAAPPAVANALHYASDHLPVILELNFETLTTVAGVEGSKPGEFELHQNYPNPFNAVTDITFRIDAPAFITLKIYDITGREVATLAAEDLPPGQHRYRWDARNFASGIYFYRIGDQLKRMVLLR